MTNGFEDLAEGLSLEVRREIAEKYFTHRKILEEDLDEYQAKLKEFEKEEEKVLQELLRLLFLLREKDLMERFAEITGVSLFPYHDEYLLNSPTIRRRLFRKLRARGLTSKGKFLRLFEETYKRLYQKFQEYQKKLRLLEYLFRQIREELREFQKNYDLGSILSFFESLSESRPSEMGVTAQKGEAIEGLAELLRFPEVPEPRRRFVDLGSLPSWGEVGSALRKLAKEAYQRHRQEARSILEEVSS
ncbi:hypothetical protein FVE67_09015 [Thermosulfurimonas marina]|uniref:Uncharacterized protein n=1 Tax=Thermosulfurimonas marina TaxID=2047767 RepID=A0A6H1WUU0_9BACT|nr:hypothetical protein [Thermosulfurimonas marina]QJA06919.1 hypothetical protein FVE67_09015 [Thermosulfurimonas marina]